MTGALSFLPKGVKNPLPNRECFVAVGIPRDVRNEDASRASKRKRI